jgi:hypothetical protein
MQTRLAMLLAILGFSAAAAGGWPELPKTGFISGRPASEKDVADGNAIFVAKANDRYIGMPLNIVIPQYAYHVEQGGQKTPVIVVQAEEANGIKIVGLRDFEGKESAATLGELQLLGTKPPD